MPCQPKMPYNSAGHLRGGGHLRSDPACSRSLLGYCCCRGTDGLLVAASCCAPESPATGRGRGIGTCDSVVSAVRTVPASRGLGRGSRIGPGRGAEAERACASVSIALAGRIGATGSVLSAGAPSFAVKGGNVPSAPSATIGRAEFCPALGRWRIPRMVNEQGSLWGRFLCLCCTRLLRIGQIRLPRCGLLWRALSDNGVPPESGPEQVVEGRNFWGIPYKGGNRRQDHRNGKDHCD
jgi:hypothetical protein